MAAGAASSVSVSPGEAETESAGSEQWGCNACGRIMSSHQAAVEHADMDHLDLRMEDALAALEAIPPGSAWTPKGAAGKPVQPPPGADTDASRFASWGYRLGAFIIDVSLLVLVMFAVDALGWEAGLSNDDAAVLAGLTLFLGWPVYMATSMALLGGRTIGKAVASIRVEKLDGRSVGFGGSLLRDSLARGFLIVLPLVEIVDYLWPLWDKRSQSLHDKMVGTVVVKGDDYDSRAVEVTAAALLAIGLWTLVSFAVY